MLQVVTLYFVHYYLLSLDVEGDKNLVDLAFAGEELDLIYLMSEQHLYKISGQKIKLTDNSRITCGFFQEWELREET